MTTATATPPTDVTTFRWTAETYAKAGDAGVFDGLRVELINGEVVVMSPINPPHAVATQLVVLALKRAFGRRANIRGQLPLDVGTVSIPQPDIVVAAGSIRTFSSRHPTGSDARIVVEVSDSTLAYDLGRKASLYAAAGIVDYWVIDLIHDLVIIHRDPRPDATQPFGHGYATVTKHASGDTVSPLAKPRSSIDVADMLP